MASISSMSHETKEVSSAFSFDSKSSLPENEQPNRTVYAGGEYFTLDPKVFAYMYQRLPLSPRGNQQYEFRTTPAIFEVLVHHVQATTNKLWPTPTPPSFCTADLEELENLALQLELTALEQHVSLQLGVWNTTGTAPQEENKGNKVVRKVQQVKRDVGNKLSEKNKLKQSSWRLPFFRKEENRERLDSEASFVD